MLEPTERTHDAECLKPRCPYCGSRDLETLTASYGEHGYRCRECTFNEHTSWFDGPHDCICAILSAARAETETKTMQAPTTPQKPAQPALRCPDCRCTELRKITLHLTSKRGPLIFYRCADCGINGEPAAFEVVEREAGNG